MPFNFAMVSLVNGTQSTFNLVGSHVTIRPGEGTIVTCFCTAFVDITTFPYRLYALEDRRDFIVPAVCFVTALTPEVLILTFVEHHGSAHEKIHLKNMGTLQLVLGS